MTEHGSLLEAGQQVLSSLHAEAAGVGGPVWAASGDESGDDASDADADADADAEPNQVNFTAHHAYTLTKSSCINSTV